MDQSCPSSTRPRHYRNVPRNRSRASTNMRFRRGFPASNQLQATISAESNVEHLQIPLESNTFNSNEHSSISSFQESFTNQATLINNNAESSYRRGRGRGARYRGVNAPRADSDQHFLQHQQNQALQHQEDRENDYRPCRRRIRARATNNLRYSSEIPGKSGEDNNDELQESTTSNLTLDMNSNLPSSSDTSNVQSGIAELQLKSNDFECMICCDNIRRTNPIWYCNNCYNIFHLKCAIEWCNKSIKSRNEAIAQSQYPSLGQPSASNQASQRTEVTPNESYSGYRAERMSSVEWPCPTCREVLYSKPDKYKCFCGKVTRPEINKHLTPHSCGQLCGRKRSNEECPHTCNSICHPGRCVPCNLTARRPCFCGKLMKEVKCSISTSSCGDVCSKRLSCGRHFCTRICHSGSCESCEETLVLNCKCGLKTVEKKCNELSDAKKRELERFSCEQTCGKLLDCGKHFCPEKCHSGPSCPSCNLLSENIKSCPCGSTQIKQSLLAERKLCTDPVPTCENKCNATLICGPEKNRHKCKKKCHTGTCPPCKLKTIAQCECKLSNKAVECSLMYQKVCKDDQVLFQQVKYTFTCETRCNKPKSCGRHRCGNKCCRYSSNSMPDIHKCDQICNRKLACGKHTCNETCHIGQCGDCTNIGWVELSCHCGSSIMYPPIPCGARAPTCHRPCRRAHNCGHPVKHECHDDTEKCAPCIVFVKKSCFCGADSKDSVYCYLSGYSCGRTCKKQLRCNQHTCQRICHEKECEPTKNTSPLCNQPCPVLRYSCKHPCSLTCHGTKPCPTSDCKKIIEIKCECGNKVERVECYKVMRDVDNRNKLAMLSTSRSNQDSIMVDLSKKLPPRSEHKSDEILKKLDCDETCLILKRNKALAEALDISQPDLKPVSIFGEDPLRLLREATVQDYKFVSSTYNTLARFVKTARESDKRFIFMPFPPATKLRREVIHELAHHFNCTSESKDEEPFKHVVVRAYKNKSAVPDFNVEQLLPVTV